MKRTRSRGTVQLATLDVMTSSPNGRVLALHAGDLVASFDGRSVTYGFGELDTLVPAYAATIHKEPWLGISRRSQPGLHRRLVVLVGQKKAVGIAVGTSWAGGGGQSSASGWCGNRSTPRYSSKP